MMRLFSAADCLILRPPHAPAAAAGQHRADPPLPDGSIADLNRLAPALKFDPFAAT